MDSKTYLQECIINRLIPFIEKNHNLNDVFFWPDLASIHYSKNVLEFLESKLEIVPRNKNPPNVPQTRGIELLWAIYKKNYCKVSKTPKNLRGFKLVLRRIMKNVSKKQ